MTPDVTVKWISVGRLHRHPHNIRKDVGPGGGLAHSLRETGQLQTLVVQPHPDLPGHYLILCGERRWTAAKKAGEHVLLCIVREQQTRGGATVLMLVENGHRRDPNPMEYAWAFGFLRDGDRGGGEEPMTVAQISAKTGFSVPSIRRYLKLLELHTDTQEKVYRGEITVSKALAAVTGTHDGQRRASGQGRPGPSARKPDHFTKGHPLAAAVRARCAAAGHTGRYKYGRVGCGPCWEEEITAAALQAAGGQAGDAAGPSASPGRPVLAVVPAAAAGAAR